MFFTEILHLLAEQTNVQYKQQAGPSHRLMLPDIMTFNALALQMGHETHTK